MLGLTRATLFMAALVFGFVPKASSQIAYEDVLSEALQRSPEIAAIEGRMVAKQASGVRLRTWQNPELDTEVRLPVSGGDVESEVAISVGQPLRASDFGLRDRINSLIEKASRLDQAAEVLEFTHGLRFSFVHVWALETRAKQLETVLGQSRSLQKLVSAGVSAGLYGSGEELLFEAESLKLLNESKGVHGELQRVRAELSRKAGYPVLGLLKRAPLLALPGDGNHEPIPSQLQAATLLKLSQEQHLLAMRDRFPRFTPRLVYERTSDGADFLGVGVTVPLAVWDKNEAEIIQSAADAKVADVNVKAKDNDTVRAELSLRERSYQAAREQAEHYEKEVLPAVKKALKAQEALLRAGQGSISQVWQTLREVSEADAKSLDLVLKAETERASLVLLRGKEF